ncbi:MAG: glutamyl-tRNA reductase [Methanoregula sp.]|jgi:glutamyl-tRNA reductase|nr:glutamyl-tRNA reductase [Methanoregula sp.]
MDESGAAPIAIAGLSHHTAHVSALEAFRFPDENELLRRGAERFKGILLIQTCNRVELIVQGEAASLSDFLQEQGRQGFFLYEGAEALRHLFLLASGIDSMIVGEDQIIGQLKKALAQAQSEETSSSLLELCINKAVHVGIEVRKRTEINRGAVSVGSAAVLLAESQLGSLQGRHILVIGSGEMGLLVAQALAAKKLTAMYVANRTYWRAKALAEKIGGKAVRLSELYHYITLSDVVISCTSAPHPIIHCKDLKEAMKARCWPVEGHPRPLILIDIAQPRDMEDGAEAIDGVRLFSIDNLRTINEETMSNRKAEAERAQQFIIKELALFFRQLNRKTADDILAALHTWAEAVRTRERDKAIARLGGSDERMAEIVDDLTRVLSKKLLTDATFAIRASAESGELEAAEALLRAITQGERFSCEPPSSREK